MRGPRRKTARDTPKRALPISLNRDLPARTGVIIAAWECGHAIPVTI
jgi:hypothetical protein